MKKKKITLLGATGSIGLQTLEMLRSALDVFDVFGIAAYGHDPAALQEIVEEFSPKEIHIFDETVAEDFRSKFPALKISSGEDGLAEIASSEAEIVINALPGAIGLSPSIISVGHGKKLILANKESLVIAGEKLMKEARKTGAEIIPLDSELSAVHQLLKNHSFQDVTRVFLTGSGGPFRDSSLWPKEKLKYIKKEDALRHPVWKMGPKITIDSATLMNKAFEVIALVRCFGIPLEKIEVVIHPQSILHAAIELQDGQMYAQMSPPDMKLAIWYSLFEGERPFPGDQNRNAFQSALTFEAPDEDRFPALRFARRALKEGEDACARLCYENDKAVAKFLAGEIGFLDIFSGIEKIFLLDHEEHAEEKNSVDFLRKFEAFQLFSHHTS